MIIFSPLTVILKSKQVILNFNYQRKIIFGVVFCLLLMGVGRAYASDWTCAPEGHKCNFSSDCCDENCVNDPKWGSVCKPVGASWTCAPEGYKCNFSSDCCEKNCVNDPKLGSVCKPVGASWTCIPSGKSCTFSSDCCGNKCVNDPNRGSVCK